MLGFIMVTLLHQKILKKSKKSSHRPFKVSVKNSTSQKRIFNSAKPYNYSDLLVMKEIQIKILATKQNHQELKFSQYRGYWGPKVMGTWVSHSGLQNDTSTWETSDQFLTNSAVLILGSGASTCGKDCKCLSRNMEDLCL